MIVESTLTKDGWSLILDFFGPFYRYSNSKAFSKNCFYMTNHLRPCMKWQSKLNCGMHLGVINIALIWEIYGHISGYILCQGIFQHKSFWTQSFFNTGPSEPFGLYKQFRFSEEYDSCNKSPMLTLRPLAICSVLLLMQAHLHFAGIRLITNASRRWR